MADVCDYCDELFSDTDPLDMTDRVVFEGKTYHWECFEDSEGK